ncbi:MAG: sugar MFS transporter [Bacteroidota bacterium]|nr:sugar MFS transporter [Bacteroidota bacterium]
MKTLLEIRENFSLKVTFYDKAILGLTFFVFGFITQLNDLLIPHLYEFGLTFNEALMLHFTFFTSYLIVSYPFAKVIDRFGYKNGIIIGLLTVSIGCFSFYFAAETRSYIFLLASLFIVGSGVSCIQIAANGYVVLQSKPKLEASNLTFAQSLNSAGRVFTVIFGTIIIYSITKINPEMMSSLSPEEYRNAETLIIKTPYLFMAILVAILAGIFYISKLPEFKTSSLPILVKSTSTSFNNVLQIRHLLLAAIAIFTYVGAEVAIGVYMLPYLMLPNIGANLITEAKAFEYIQYYWGMALAGRIIGGFILKDLSPRKVVAGFALSAAFFTCVSVFSNGNIAIISIVAVGFFNSILFPSIFTLGINGLGHFAEEGASILIASIVGGAIIPLLVISVSDFTGLQYAYLIPAACYLYIVYFGLYGSRFNKVESAEYVG